MSILFWKNNKHLQHFLCYMLIFSLGLSSLFLFSGCGITFVAKSGNQETEDEKFESYTEKLFCKEVSASQISLHYTLREPEKYRIDKSNTAYGAVSVDSTQVKAAAENIQQSLLSFSYEDLDVKNRITYDLLNKYLRNLKEEADYLYYEEPLNTVSGIQTQIPVVLSEYQFYERKDVEDYLKVLGETRDYFQQVIAFEQAKSKKGLFLSNALSDRVIEQCRAFLEMGNGN